MFVSRLLCDGKMTAITLRDRDCGFTGGKLRYFLLSLNTWCQMCAELLSVAQPHDGVDLVLLVLVL